MAKSKKQAAKRIKCDQCEALMINGVFCHETGCPNTNARYDESSDTWVKQRKCFTCGCTVDADDPCCSAVEDTGAPNVDLCEECGCPEDLCPGTFHHCRSEVDEICLCGAPMKDGVCSVPACVASGRRTVYNVLDPLNEANKPLGDGDYTLTDCAAWFTVGNFSVRIAQHGETGENVLHVDVYPVGKEANNSLGSLRIK